MRMDKRNEIYTGAQGRKSVYDLIVPENWNGQLILFMHGYKGYKDWGAWHLMGKAFTDENYAFCAINFSHNGGSVENPIDFPDLEAYAQNRYSFEVKDAHIMVDLLKEKFAPSHIHLIGHSRGGGIAALCAAQNQNINTLITLAAVDDFEKRFIQGEALNNWQKEGVFSVKNGRTLQDMPHYYSFYTDYFENEAQLNIGENLKTLQKPALHIHGSEDEAVDPSCSLSLAKHSKGKLVIVEGTGHTFHSKHPWENDQLPTPMQEAVQHILNFIQ